jgi:eukaryotic-like serine/threonine-protein kinase
MLPREALSAIIRTMLAGQQLGAFRIGDRLGVGGMGEVYRARDTKLGRDVAIKILPPAFATDPDRLARFTREAQVLASLNHPHIAAIYGFEDAGDVRALVLELVDGPTLADRIAHGSLPPEEALPIARQIADALEAAHEHGVVHRDLKPANIKVRDDGTVKVLDFGLAKLSEPVAAGVDGQSPLSLSPTITTPAMTAAGIILGTAAYMSPEQAKGKPADRRSDVWAFGCVLYEMLTGRRAFDGEDISDTLATVLKGDPDWTVLPAQTSPAVRRLLRRSLEKDRRRRLADIADARLELEEREEPRPAPGESIPKPTFGNPAIVLLTLGALIASGAAGLLLWPRTDRPPEMRVEINTPPTPRPESLSISPDGRAVAFVGEADGRPQIWIRPLDTDRSHPLPGTDHATYMFWSPDSRALGFFAEGRLKRIDLESGAIRALAPAPRGFGGSWAPDGTILFNVNAGGIYTVPAQGGDVKTIVPVGTGGSTGGFRAPTFLPDGQHFLLYQVGGRRGVYVGSIRGGDPAYLFDADAAAIYIREYLLFVRQGLLYAQPFDATRLTLGGVPVAIAGGNIPSGAGGTDIPAVSASPAGIIAFRSASQAGQRQFTWVDRNGAVLSAVGDADSFNVFNPSLSRDGHRIAYNETRDNNTDLWIRPNGQGQPSRLTTDPGLDQYPLWSPDGKSVVFSSIRAGGFDLYQKNADDVSAPEKRLLVSLPRAKVATDWSLDGRFLLFRLLEVKGYDVWALPMQGDPTPFPVLQGDADDRDAVFSPDGQWIAFESDRSGRSDIYVDSFPKPQRTFGPFTKDGGTQVRWSADGKELFYIATDGYMMSVPVEIDNTAGTVTGKTPARLFASHVPTLPQRQQYVVSSDGKRFLINMQLDQESGFPITMILNWNGPSKR